MNILYVVAHLSPPTTIHVHDHDELVRWLLADEGYFNAVGAEGGLMSIFGQEPAAGPINIDDIGRPDRPDAFL